MPFEIRWITNRKKNLQAAYQSTLNPAIGFVFNLRKPVADWDLYGCSFCTSAATKRKKNGEHCPTIPSIRVSGDLFLDDPEKIYHVCAEDENIDRSWEKIVVNHHYNNTTRALAENAAQGGSRITSARSAQVLMERAIRREDPQIVDLASSMKKTKRVFNYSVSQFRQKADNARNLPQELRLLGAPRPRNIGMVEREGMEDFFLIYQEERANLPPFLVFASLTGIKQLHSMQYFACDGTYEKCPKDFEQLYSLHAIHHSMPYRIESTLIAFALMKNKAAEDYRHFFDILSGKLQESFFFYLYMWLFG